MNEVGLVLFVFALVDLLFFLLVMGWAMQVAMARRETISVQRANVALASMVSIDLQGTVVSVNPEVARMFGYEPAEVVGHNVKMLMTDKDRDKHDGYLRRYLETNDPHIIGIGRLVYGRKKDGTPFPLELAVSPQYGADGRILFFNGQMRDATAKQWAEAVGIKT
jgi:two-component system, LuxR family, sensor kinase FixL